MHGDGLVRIVTGWELHGPEFEYSQGQTFFSFCHHHIQISSVAHPSYPMGTRHTSCGDKVAGAWADRCHPLQLRLMHVVLYLFCHIHLHDTVLKQAQGEHYRYWHSFTVWVLIMHILNASCLILILYFPFMKDFYLKKGGYRNLCIMFEVLFWPLA